MALNLAKEKSIHRQQFKTGNQKPSGELELFRATDFHQENKKTRHRLGENIFKRPI